MKLEQGQELELELVDGQSVVGSVLCAVEASTHKGKLLHNVLHSSLVYTLPKMKRRKKYIFINNSHFFNIKSSCGA